MKIKYFLAGLLCVCLGTSIMTACANPQSAQSSEAQEVKTEKLHKLYIRAPKEFTELTVMFSCTGSGKTADVKMTKSGEDDTCAIFSCEADVNLYNLVRVKNGEKEGFDVAFNSFVSGWNFEDMKTRCRMSRAQNRAMIQSLRRRSSSLTAGIKRSTSGLPRIMTKSRMINIP